MIAFTYLIKLISRPVYKQLLLIVALITSMAFSASAAAFLHLSEHQHLESHCEHFHIDDDHQHDGNIEADHAHHFNLHVVGDLVEYDSLSFTKYLSSTGGELYSRLVTRTYSPPIPPPNA